MSSTKDQSRIASILGTWIFETKINIDIHNMGMRFFCVIHIVCDSQLKGNYCSLPGCSEIENDVCMLNSTGPRCVSMQDGVVDWSDVAAFLYIGTEVDIGSFDLNYTTGGWIGPYSMIMAQNQTSYLREDGKKVLDSYSIKWIKSPTTPYLKMPHDCELFSKEDFYFFLGPGAVQNTVNAQAIGASATSDYDAYELYYKTCENGNVKPILPFAQFDFVQDPNLPTTDETISVKLKYEVLVFPGDDTMAYDKLPEWQKRGAPINGPYCYEGDPNRGWTTDFAYDSEENNKWVTLYHACVEGIPCLPPALNSCHCASTGHSNGSQVFPADSSRNTINLQIAVILSILIGVVGVLVLFCIFLYWMQSKKYARLREERSKKLDCLGTEEKESNDEPRESSSQPLLQGTDQ